MREVLRGVVVKEWIVMPNEGVDFSPRNKALVDNGVRFCSAYRTKGVKFFMNQKRNKRNQGRRKKRSAY